MAMNRVGKKEKGWLRRKPTKQGMHILTLFGFSATAK
jgi:hypothetical protein